LRFIVPQLQRRTSRSVQFSRARALEEESGIVSSESTPAKRRAPRLVALAFVAAFAASVLTVIYTGLLVEAPRTRISAGLPSIAMTAGERRDVNLVFNARAEVADAALLVELPNGVELVGHAGEQRIQWRTRLAPGNNIVPLTLVAPAPAAGQIIARLKAGDREKVFRIHVTVNPGESR
jgi:hypothetical protein